MIDDDRFEIGSVRERERDCLGYKVSFIDCPSGEPSFDFRFQSLTSHPRCVYPAGVGTSMRQLVR